ncbi:MAG: 50S ribosomal protein L6 [Flavobacteriaceae bacterium]|nr:50S ribosomal protein L6 [Flavobacteriaceae bacterium]
MSRIGNAPIDIPQGVTVTVDKNIVTVKGPKGELKQELSEGMKVSQEDGVLTIERPSESKDDRAKHGLYRSLINNMVEGVSNGFVIKQELVGVGFRATSNGQILELSVGYSHPIHIELAKEIKVTAETEKRGNPIITLESCDKQLLGQVAAKIRSFRAPEPYKGKGIKFVGEELRKKAGKSASV